MKAKEILRQIVATAVFVGGIALAVHWGKASFPMNSIIILIVIMLIGGIWLFFTPLSEIAQWVKDKEEKIVKILREEDDEEYEEEYDEYDEYSEEYSDRVIQFPFPQANKTETSNENSKEDSEFEEFSREIDGNFED